MNNTSLDLDGSNDSIDAIVHDWFQIRKATWWTSYKSYIAVD